MYTYDAEQSDCQLRDVPSNLVLTKVDYYTVFTYTKFNIHNMIISLWTLLWLASFHNMTTIDTKRQPNMEAVQGYTKRELHRTVHSHQRERLPHSTRSKRREWQMRSLLLQPKRRQVRDYIIQILNILYSVIKLVYSKFLLMYNYDLRNSLRGQKFSWGEHPPWPPLFGYATTC